MATTLVLNPRDDLRFVALAEAIVAEGAASPAELQVRLRSGYPDAIVRARELAGEASTTWYCYRDGHWTPSQAQDTRGG